MFQLLSLLTFVVATCFLPVHAYPDAVRLETDEETAKRVKNSTSEKKEFPESAIVYGVNKGDEVLLKTGESVRLIGVDAPTAEYEQQTGEFYGKAALDLVKREAEGRTVRLEYDKQKRDLMGRLLAYIYLEDGRMLNEILVREGHAVAGSFPPNTRYCNRFAAQQRRAVGERLGIWKIDLDRWPDAQGQGQSRAGVIGLVLDGDTVKLESGEVIRYIGIDAPESEKNYDEGSFGHEAYRANRLLVEGKPVRLELDVTAKDPAGRTLAYVYVTGADGQEIFVNEALVKAGQAWVAVFPPNVNRIRQLFDAQQTAADAKIGIWKE